MAYSPNDLQSLIAENSRLRKENTDLRKRVEEFGKEEPVQFEIPPEPQPPENETVPEHKEK